MQIGDLVRSKAQREQIGVITGLRRNSMNSSDKYTTYYIYWSHLGETQWSDYSALEAIRESR